MNRHYLHIFSLLFAILLFANCIQGKSVKTLKTTQIVPSFDIPPISHNDSLRLKFFYLEAVNQQISGNFDSAYDLLQHCLEIAPNSAETYFMLSFYDGILKGDSAAFADIKKAADINPDNNAYLERLATGYIETSNMEEASKAYEKLYKNNSERSDILDILVQLYAQQRDYDNMLTTIERMEALEGSSEQTALAKMRVYSLQGNKEEELNVLKDLSAQHPNDMNYRVMMGNWLLQNGNEEEAFDEYTYALQQEPDNTTAKMSLIDYYKTIDQQEKADSIQEALLINPKTPMESKMLLMRRVVANNENSSKDSTEVLDLFKRILKQPQKTSDMAELYAAYMTLKKMPQDSISKALAMVLDIDPNNKAARIQLIQAFWGKQDYDEVIRLSKQAIDYIPDEMAFFYFLGLAYVQKDEDDEAIETFQKGVTMADEDSDSSLVSDFYAIMGDLLHSKGMAEEAYAAYDSCLQWKDDNIGCLNNYAYYLSEENKDLPRAEQMSYRTIQSEPSNSTYLDTFAWILFKQGRYDEAMQYIDMAVSNDTTESAVIIEHAGDIHAVNDDIDTAVEYWQKAIDIGTDNETIITRKIKERKYIDEK
ncbi:MAG: tetratricopeptide repeat protein [Prevotella sp.]|nr:tetratricopeptide repeat protein [Prevotella sp.]